MPCVLHHLAIMELRGSMVRWKEVLHGSKERKRKARKAHQEV